METNEITLQPTSVRSVQINAHFTIDMPSNLKVGVEYDPFDIQFLAKPLLYVGKL